MKLNGTLFIQMLNFGIAYCMIRYFLLRPIVPMIMRERKKIVELQYRIASSQESLTALEQEQAGTWQKLNTYTTSKQLPSFFDPLQKPALHFDLPSVPIATPDTQEIENIGSQIVNTIMHQKLWGHD